MVSESDLIWFAGFFDGEGSLFLHAVHKTKDDPIFQPVLQVANTHLAAMERCLKVISGITNARGSFQAIQRECKKGPYRPIYLLRIRKRAQIIEICKAILPHLTARREQANLTIEYIRFASSGRAKGQNIRGIGLQMYQEMARLNKRYAPGEWQSQARDLIPGSAKADEGKVRASRRREEALETSARLLPFDRQAVNK